MASLRGKVVLITGASSGIGAGTAVHFAKLGSRLALTGRNSDSLQHVASECTEQGSEVLTITGDINKVDDRKSMVDRTVDRYGRLDVLVNNVGMLYNAPLSQITPEMYDEQMDTNCRSHVFLTQLAIPDLVKAKGSLVNISSICGPNSMPEVGGYCVSKAAMDKFTQCLALELAPKGVRVNSINPGTIVSNIARRPHGKYQDDAVYQEFLKRQAAVHPLGRVGQPDDCAEAIAFLASDAASFITGQILYIDDGRHCCLAGVATNVKK